MATTTTSNGAASVLGGVDNSGLHHLADAATALTQLIDTVPALSESKRARAHTVSDDDERSSVGESHTSLHNGKISPTSPKCILENTNLDGSKQIFPQRFMNLLNEPSISEVITWLPHGQSFIIFKPTVFTEKILPAYFPESCAEKKSLKTSNSSACKYPSFTRKLNRWGFRQVSRGTDAGAFHHKLFQRDKPDLCLQMVCQRSRRRKNDKKADDDTSTGSDAGSIEPSVAFKPSEETGSSINNNKRKFCGPNGTLVTDSESDTSTLQNEGKRLLPPKKRKHHVKTDLGNVAHIYRSVTPPRLHCSSDPNLPHPTSRSCSTGSDSSVQSMSEISKGRVNPTAQAATPSLLQSPAKTYLNARALLEHNVALNNIHSLNTAVAMAQVHTQRASLRSIPTLLDNLVVLANNASTQKAPSVIHNLPLSHTKSPNNMALSSAKTHSQLQTSSDNSKENEAKERAINAKKMLYSAFLEALK